MRDRIKHRPVKEVLAIAVIGLVLLTVASCTGKISLELYLEQLDEIRARSDKASAAIESELDSIQNGPGALAALKSRISSAEKVVEECRKDIEKLSAPAAAAELDRLVLDLHSESAAFFVDIESMLDYTARREPLVGRVEAASTQLDSTIAANPSAASASAALEAARASVREAEEELKKLNPPSFLKGVHKALLGMLDSYAASLSSLGAAVQSGNASAIASAQAELRKSLSGNLAEETKTAIKAYNARIENIVRLREEANKEETKITSGPG
jgi:chromosome segregation ATPase